VPSTAGSDLPSVEAMPVFFVTGRPYTRPQAETEPVARALAAAGLISWPKAVTRVARASGVDRADAEAMLIRALRDPRGLLIGLLFRGTGALAVRVQKPDS
jgi:hypothetical protein